MDAAILKELQLLRAKIAKLEQELADKQPIRVDKIEYKVEKLYVESIDHGVLDLGVHFGGQQPLVPLTAESPDSPVDADTGLDGLPESIRECMLSMEQRVADLEAAFEELSEWRRQMECRLSSLEKGADS